MRIIAGEFRSRRIKTPEGLEVRPTPDRLRETLFNILAPEIEGSVFLDAYAGSGAVGIEAISRGAAQTIFVEKHRTAFMMLQENTVELGLKARALLVKGSARLTLERFDPDIVFIDPPYELEAEYHAVLEMLGEKPPGLVTVVQHSARFSLKDRYGKIKRTRVKKQGDNSLSFYRVADLEEPKLDGSADPDPENLSG